MGVVHAHVAVPTTCVCCCCNAATTVKCDMLCVTCPARALLLQTASCMQYSPQLSTAVQNLASTCIESMQYCCVSPTCHGRAMRAPRLVIGSLQDLHLELTDIVDVRLCLVCKILDLALRAWHIPAATTVQHCSSCSCCVLGLN
jgi:hypothetical protein